MAEVMAAISSSAWNVRTPKFLCRDQLVQNVAGRRDRIAAVEQFAAAPLRRRRSGPRPVASLPVILRYVPGGSLALGTA